RPEGLKCRSACHLKTGSSGPSSGTSQNRQRSGNAMDKVRIDKWLWAARFFKTRNLAKTAIEGGKVHCRGERCKPARDLRIGDELQIRCGYDLRTVVVEALSEVRRGAPEAQLLYRETEDSIRKREEEAQLR